MQIDDSLEQFKNADVFIRESFEPDSNETVEREEHEAKQDLPIVSTVEGMQIDDSNEQYANVKPPIDESTEPLSNTTLEGRPAKQV
jgi:hypothetical protein